MAKVTPSENQAESNGQARDSRIRPALQARSQATQQRILDVVDRLVRDGRFESATVSDITRAAGCSVGAFYGRFSDKDAALLSFYAGRCEALEKTSLAVLGQGKTKRLRPLLREMIDVLVRNSIEYREFLKAFQSRFTSGDTEFLARSAKMNKVLIAALAIALDMRREEFDHPQPEIAAVLVMAMIGGMTRDAILYGAKIIEGEVAPMDFTAELERAVAGYLHCR